MITLGPYTFTTQDALRTLGNLGGLWAHMLDRRSSAADALGNDLRTRLAAALRADPAADLHELGRLASATLGDAPDLLAEVLADSWNTLRVASDVLRADGQMPATATGTVVQVSSSKGGVPKAAVDSADVDHRGVVGDLQRVRIHHGRPWQALCIYADEVIDLLRAEGHPIGRGSVGENVTVAGLDWGEVRPGVMLQIGTVLAHVQAYAEPCRSNARFFLGGDFQRMNVNRGAVSRVYATVLKPGRVATGDAVVLEPTAA